MKRLFIGAIALIYLTCIAWTPSAMAVSASSTIMGLAKLKTMARQSVPYEVAINAGKPMLLEFYADWCTTCQSMAPQLDSLHQEYEAQINLVMLNIDDPHSKQQIQQYGVTGVPQFTVLSAKGEVVDSLVGRVPRKIFVQIFERL